MYLRVILNEIKLPQLRPCSFPIKITRRLLTMNDHLIFNFKSEWCSKFNVKTWEYWCIILNSLSMHFCNNYFIE